MREGDHDLRVGVVPNLDPYAPPRSADEAPRPPGRADPALTSVFMLGAAAVICVYQLVQCVNLASQAVELMVIRSLAEGAGGAGSYAWVAALGGLVGLAGRAALLLALLRPSNERFGQGMGWLGPTLIVVAGFGAAAATIYLGIIEIQVLERALGWENMTRYLHDRAIVHGVASFADGALFVAALVYAVRRHRSALAAVERYLGAKEARKQSRARARAANAPIGVRGEAGRLQP